MSKKGKRKRLQADPSKVSTCNRFVRFADRAYKATKSNLANLRLRGRNPPTLITAYLNINLKSIYI